MKLTKPFKKSYKFQAGWIKIKYMSEFYFFELTGISIAAYKYFCVCYTCILQFCTNLYEVVNMDRDICCVIQISHFLFIACFIFWFLKYWS